MTNTLLNVVSTLRQYSVISDSIEHLGISFKHRPSTRQGHNSSSMRDLLKGSQIAVVGDDTIDRSVFEACPELRLVIRWGAGIDNVDLVAAKTHGVEVQNTPGLFGEDVADLAISLSLSCVRGIVKNDREIREGRWPKDTVHSFRDMKAAILGAGAVGREIARLLSAFGLVVKVYDPAVPAGEGQYWRAVDSIQKCVAEANLLFVCLPLNNETRGLVGAKLLKGMGTPSYVVNVARGEVVDEKALFKMIDSDQISGAGLDVFLNEPLNPEDLPGKSNMVVLSSHNASNTFSSIARANKAVDKLIEDFASRGLL